jgi:hypothetical protein
MKPHEQMPDRCREFVSWLHRSRAELGSEPVTDDVAVEAFDMIWEFAEKWRAGPLLQIPAFLRNQDNLCAEQATPETGRDERCPHGYVISDTTHQCKKCGPLETPVTLSLSEERSFAKVFEQSPRRVQETPDGLLHDKCHVDLPGARAGRSVKETRSECPADCDCHKCTFP